MGHPVHMMNEVMMMFLGLSCGTVERDGLVTDVVAAGGYHIENAAYIYNIADRTWRAGMVYLGTRSIVTTHLFLTNILFQVRTFLH